MIQKIYSNYVFPRLCDFAMSGEHLGKHRKDALQMTAGKILEIGFGTGLNLRHYPQNINRIDGLDVSEKIISLAKKRIQQSSIEVNKLVLSGENLPMPDEEYDCVVSTFTLCSIPDIDRALGEIHRVLKPDGKLVFLEHGLSQDAKVRTWQERLNPLQKVIGEGCHLNRDIPELLRDSAFAFENLQNFHLERVPRILGYCSQGIAIKSNSLDYAEEI